MPLRWMLLMIAVSALAPVHQPSVSNRPVPRSKRIISAVAAAVRRSQAFQVLRAHAVQTISGRSPAFPHARSAPTPVLPQSSTLNWPVRRLLAPEGIVPSPSFEPSAHVRPPSNDRSSQTSSPAEPFSTEPHAIASVSLTCILKVRPYRPAVTGTRSAVASAASRPSQYLLQIAAVTAGAAEPELTCGETAAAIARTAAEAWSETHVVMKLTKLQYRAVSMKCARKAAADVQVGPCGYSSGWPALPGSGWGWRRSAARA